MTENENQPRQFFRALESLRGIAALSVAIYHVSWMNPFYEWNLVRNGYLMVDFFFVLSGFVICHSYGMKIANRSALIRFMWLRVGRLYPLHLCLALLFLGYQSLELVHELFGGDVGRAPFFSHFNPYVAVTNILAIHGLIDPGGILNGPSWSISTEIFAYLVFATTQFLCRSEAKLGLASLAIVIGSLGILGSVGRLQSLDLIADYSFFRCTTGFFVGVITRLVLQRTRRASAKLSAMVPPGALVGASLLAMIGFLSLKSRGQSDFWMIPGVAILIWLVASSPKNRVNEALEASWLSWLGKVSYSIYMVHWGVALIFSAALKALGTPTRHLADLGRDILDPGPAPGLLCLVLFVGTVLALSHVTFHLIEEPFRLRSRRLAERWFAR